MGSLVSEARGEQMRYFIHAVRLRDALPSSLLPCLAVAWGFLTSFGPSQVIFSTVMVFNILVTGLLLWVENPDRRVHLLPTVVLLMALGSSFFLYSQGLPGKQLLS